MSSRMTLTRLREVLGEEAENLTDTQLTEYRDQLFQLSNVILEAYDEFSLSRDANLTAILKEIHPSPEQWKGIVERCAKLGYDLEKNWGSYDEFENWGHDECDFD